MTGGVDDNQPLEPGLQPIPLARQSTAERWNRFVSSTAFQRVQSLLKLSEWRLQEGSGASIRERASNTPAVTPAHWKDTFRNATLMVDLLADIRAQGEKCTADILHEARCQKRRRALSRSEGMLLFSSVLDDASKLLDDVSTMKIDSAPSAGRKTSFEESIGQSVMFTEVVSHLCVLFGSFSFAMRGMNDPNFILKVQAATSQAGTWPSLYRLAPGMTLLPIHKTPHEHSPVVGYLSRGCLVHLVVDATSGFARSAEVAANKGWLQMASGNWVCSRHDNGDLTLVLCVSTKSKKQMANVMFAHRGPSSDENLLAESSNSSSTTNNTHNFGKINNRRNIVSPIHFLQGSSINNQIVVESLAGVLLGLKKISLCGKDHAE
eukprot:INCI623.1.p2 GENE.INCI623.1~~INCI623.1.p2  ORF type:complete len:424 (-),score=89.28 INCI623.1:1810-2943(-)